MSNPHNTNTIWRTYLGQSAEPNVVKISTTPDNIIFLRPKLPYEAVIPAGIPEVDLNTRNLVLRLRHLLQQSLLRPRQDLDKACILIAADPEVTAERYAAAFFHGLELYGRRNIQFFTLKAQEISTDEMWMTRLLEAFQGRNDINARYLLSLRVEPLGRRRLSFLANGLARELFLSRSDSPVANQKQNIDGKDKQ